LPGAALEQLGLDLSRAQDRTSYEERLLAEINILRTSGIFQQFSSIFRDKPFDNSTGTVKIPQHIPTAIDVGSGDIKRLSCSEPKCPNKRL
jgi:hypothetical protein